MARYIQPVCRLCRREGVKLFLKGDRCFSEKCSIERREYAPGQHGQSRRGKASEYSTHLREKQKIRQTYGLLERQFRNTYQKAARMKGVKGTNFLRLLESRADNLVYRMGFANSRSEARLLVTQNHFLVNKKRMNIPSAHLKPGDFIEVREKSRKAVRILAALEAAERRGIPEWLLLDKEKMTGEIKALPAREQLTMPMNENLVVEYYSK